MMLIKMIAAAAAAALSMDEKPAHPGLRHAATRQQLQISKLCQL
jgi:hypothetical protein